MMIATERLYVTADKKKVVKEDDPKAAFLLAGKGQEIEDVIVRQYGLLKKKSKPENKQADAPENKQISSPQNKGKGSRKEK